MEGQSMGQPGGPHTGQNNESACCRPRILGGLIVLVTGVSFLLATMEVIDWDEWFSYFMIMLGGAFLVDVLITRGSTEPRVLATGRLIAGLVLLVIGLGTAFGMEFWWPLIIIAVGVVVLVNGLRARGRA